MNTTLCLSTELCCIVAGFPTSYLHNNRIFACHVLDFMVQGEDNRHRCTNSLAVCHPIRTNSPSPPFLHQIPPATLPIYRGLGQAPSMLVFIPSYLWKQLKQNKFLHIKQECTHREQTSADPDDPDFGLWTPGSEA